MDEAIGIRARREEDGALQEERTGVRVFHQRKSDQDGVTVWAMLFQKTLPTCSDPRGFFGYQRGFYLAARLVEKKPGQPT
ncbi:MAG: hypothetical protein M3495_00575 [Pseudomonadota bacterium]|nr:hypothetical protein [Pseudomonadota bacterium]